MMIPITRKEKYINEIVGGGDTAPKTPQTREEFFFADILGEVIAPSPVTRAEKYLSAIAGQYSGDLPTPATRIEYFLARAAGMDITVPIPITREEIYWSNYTAIVEFEIENVPPLTYKAIEGTLKNYRIYGQTVDGESVGDRTGNLFDFDEWSKNINVNRDNSLAKGIDGITITANSNDAFTTPYAHVHEDVYKIYVKPNTNYLLSWVSNNNLFGRVFIFKNGIPDGTYAVNVNNNATKYLLFGTDADTEFVTLRFGVSNAGDSITYSKIMLIEGSTALPYEPYGYKMPVTVSNGTDAQTTTIYLDAPLEKSGNNADYIDYATQKRHNSDGTESSVTLPEISTLSGTNTLTVGTEIQPSKVYIKGEKEREYT